MDLYDAQEGSKAPLLKVFQYLLPAQIVFLVTCLLWDIKIPSDWQLIVTLFDSAPELSSLCPRACKIGCEGRKHPPPYGSEFT